MYVHAHPPTFDLQACQEGTRQLQEAGLLRIRRSGGIFANTLMDKKLGDTHRIHGAGIYANMTGVYGWDPCYHI